MFQATPSAEADGDIKELWSRRAKDMNRNQQVETETETMNALVNCDIGVGLQGIGDSEYPISVKLLGSISGEKEFVKRCSIAWKQMTSGAVSQQAKMKEYRVPTSKCCLGFCFTAACETRGADRMRLTIGLLQNILRYMRGKQLPNLTLFGKQKRHPLVLVKQDTGVRGWLITRASFKPLHLYGWCLRLDQEGLNSEQESVAELQFVRNHATGQQRPYLQSNLRFH